MYRVYVYNQKDYYPLHEPLDEGLRIFSPIITQEIGCAGYFEFMIYAFHANYHALDILKSEVIVYNNEKEIFRGRILKPKTSMDNMVSITCEGELTYLLDSRQRPYEYTGPIQTFIEAALESHNSQVDDFKKIHVGNIIVAENITVSDAGYSTTLDTIKNKVVEPYGGYLRIRHEDNKRYLDYVWDYGGYNKQVIRFGENLLDLNRYIDASSLITCLIPAGANVEYVDDSGQKGTRRLDITSINNGADYIENAEAVERYGRIYGYHSWNDITDPRELIEKAEAYLREMSALPGTIEVTAIDLAQIDENVAEFELGCWTQISSEPHWIEKEYILSKRVINLLDPAQGSITLGKSIKTFVGGSTEIENNVIKTITDVTEKLPKEIDSKVENATKLITGGLGGYIVIDTVDPSTGETTHPWRILIMNTPDRETATHIIQINQNGIGFSTTGINGPYENAWTIDGNLIADFITAGTMLADRIRGGTLEIGGKGTGKDGVIYVKDSAGTTIGQIDKNGISINKGSINLGNGNFIVTSGGVLTLQGTNNSTSIGANVVNTNHLQVWDRIDASGASFNIGGMWSSGGFVSGSFMGDFHGSFYETSDKRKKRKVKRLDNKKALELVTKLKPVSYILKKTNESKMGFIAQDVIELKKQLEEDLPLTHIAEDGYYEIPYANYIVLLAGAIQEQQKEIETLKKEKEGKENA